MLDIVQTQITKYLSLINIRNDARYCWKFEDISCDKKEIPEKSYIVSDYSYLTEGKAELQTSTKNLKIRIVPDINWIEGNYDGIVCDLNGSGYWGDRCVLHTNEKDFMQSNQCQLVIFEDSNDSWRWEKEETSIFYAEKSCSEIIGKYTELDISNTQYTDNNNSTDNYGSCYTNSLGAYAYIGQIELDSWQYIPDSVFTPNENTCWSNGETVTIQWDASRISNGNKVMILILYDNPFGISDYNPDVCLIASRNWSVKFSNVDNTGQFTFDASQLSGVGNAYKILIITDHGEWGMSKGTFSLNICD